MDTSGTKRCYRDKHDKTLTLPVDGARSRINACDEVAFICLAVLCRATSLRFKGEKCVTQNGTTVGRTTVMNAADW